MNLIVDVNMLDIYFWYINMNDISVSLSDIYSTEYRKNISHYDSKNTLKAKSIQH